MNDTELSPAEDARLRQLLQRAAEGVEVVMPTAVPGSGSTVQHRSGGPWVLAAAAVVVLLGGGLWLTATGDDRVDTGPAAVVDGDLPTALRETGIWRLPTELPEGTRIGGAYLLTSRVPAFQLAVDDPDQPTRWLGIWPVGVDLEDFGGMEVERVEGGGDRATVTLFRHDDLSATGSDWIEIEGARNAWSAVVAFRGVPAEEAMAIAADVAAAIGDTSDVEAMRDGLRQLRMPDGLVPTWDPQRVGYDIESTEPTGISLILIDESSSASDTEPLEAMAAGIAVQRTGLPPQIASLALRLERESAAGSAPDGTISERPLDDVGPGALMLEAQGAEYPSVFATDGTTMALSIAPGASRTWPAGESLSTLLSLRTMSEQEFRAELARLGVDLQSDLAASGRSAAAASGGSASEPTGTPGPTTTVLGLAGG